MQYFVNCLSDRRDNVWEKAASPKLWSLFRSAVEDEWVLLNGVPCKAAHPTPLASTAGRMGNKSSWQECMEVYKQMHRPQDSAYNLSTSEHDISPSCYERYLQYVPCVLVDLPGGGPGRIESPPAWLWLLAGGRIPSSTVSGRNLLKLNQTFTIWSALFFLPPIKALQTYNKGPSHLFVAILLLMGHYFGSCYKSAGQAFSLSRAPIIDSWALGQYWWAHGSTLPPIIITRCSAS